MMWDIPTKLSDDLRAEFLKRGLHVVSFFERHYGFEVGVLVQNDQGVELAVSACKGDFKPKELAEAASRWDGKKRAAMLVGYEVVELRNRIANREYEE